MHVLNRRKHASQHLNCVGEKMMVPLTESLYVEGFVHEKDKILVDVGTGYFAEVCSHQYKLICDCAHPKETHVAS